MHLTMTARLFIYLNVVVVNGLCFNDPNYPNKSSFSHAHCCQLGGPVHTGLYVDAILPTDLVDKFTHSQS